MIDIEAQLLEQDDGWRDVLEAYRLPEDEEADEAGSVDLENELIEQGWLPRVEQLSGFDDGRLSQLHGRLVALGWLGFDVAGRQSGIQYRLTRDGQRVLDGLVPVPTLTLVTTGD